MAQVRVPRRSRRAFAAATFIGVAATVGACFFGIDESKIRAGDDRDGGTDGITSPDAGLTDPGDSPSTRSLVGYWRFEEEGLIANDESGFSHHGNLAGAPTRGPGRADAGRALTLRAADSLEVPSLGRGNFPRAGTLSFWFALDARGVLPLFDKTTPETPERPRFSIEYNLSFIPAFAVRFHRADGGAVDMGSLLGTERWQHLIVVWEPRLALIWFSGGTEPVTRRSSMGLDDFDPSGQCMCFGPGFGGQIDEVRLYDRPLRDEEVQRIP